MKCKLCNGTGGFQIGVYWGPDCIGDDIEACLVCKGTGEIMDKDAAIDPVLLTCQLVENVMGWKYCGFCRTGPIYEMPDAKGDPWREIHPHHFWPTGDSTDAQELLKKVDPAKWLQIALILEDEICEPVGNHRWTLLTAKPLEICKAVAIAYGLLTEEKVVKPSEDPVCPCGISEVICDI